METLTAAIMAALGNLGVKAVGDAYEGVKTLVQRKFGAESDLVDALKKLEKQPDAKWRQDALQDAVKAQPGGGLNPLIF
ncbi:MAG: hypothetical protein ACTFAL_15180 [Candidatus Electronema sp. V4]|uniref:hypothetical protein n=1 Tax=Candidatus Electronema sp. V4 TaxID=3454756 RepID=UPI0040553781